jgi:hypothetical protein
MFTSIKPLNRRSNDYAAHLRCLEVRQIATKNLRKKFQALRAKIGESTMENGFLELGFGRIRGPGGKTW